MRQQIGIDFRKKLMCYPGPLPLLFHPPVDLCVPPRFLGVLVLAPGNESRIPLLMRVRSVRGGGVVLLTKVSVCCAGCRARCVQRRRVKPVTRSPTRRCELHGPAAILVFAAAIRRLAITDPTARWSWGLLLQRGGLLTGCMVWWLRLEWGWHRQRALLSYEESVTMYWQKGVITKELSMYDANSAVEDGSG